MLLKARWYNKVSQYEQNKYWVGKLTSLAFPSKQTVRPLKLGNILPLTRGFEKSDMVNEIIFVFDASKIAGNKSDLSLLNA